MQSSYTQPKNPAININTTSKFLKYSNLLLLEDSYNNHNNNINNNSSIFSSNNNHNNEKQNLISLSNQNNQSLLVSSMRASNSTYKQCQNNTQNKQNYHKNKQIKQNKFNSQAKYKQNNQNNQYLLDKNNKNINNKKQKSKVILQPQTTQNNNLTFSYSPQFKKSLYKQNCDNSLCLNKINKLQQKIITNEKRLEQVQTMLKILFSNKIYTQNLINTQKNQMQQINFKIQQKSKQINKINQNTIRSQTILTNKLQKLTQKVTKISQTQPFQQFQKQKQACQLIQLQFLSVQQKIQLLSNFNQQTHDKFHQMIQMIGQIAKNQQKLQQQKYMQSSSTLLSPIDNKNYIISIPRDEETVNMKKGIYYSYSLNKNNHNYHDNKNKNIMNKCNNNSKKYQYQQQQQKQKQYQNKSKSKSKISYYLSKSNFNQMNSTLGDIEENNYGSTSNNVFISRIN